MNNHSAGHYAQTLLHGTTIPMEFVHEMLAPRIALKPKNIIVIPARELGIDLPLEIGSFLEQLNASAQYRSVVPAEAFLAHKEIYAALGEKGTASDMAIVAMQPLPYGGASEFLLRLSKDTAIASYIIPKVEDGLHPTRSIQPHHYIVCAKK